MLKLRVKVRMSGVLTFSVWRDVTEPPLDTIVGIEVLQVLYLRVSNFLCSINKVGFRSRSTVCAIRNVDWTIKSMMLFFARAVIRFQLLGC